MVRGQEFRHLFIDRTTGRAYLESGIEGIVSAVHGCCVVPRAAAA